MRNVAPSRALQRRSRTFLQIAVLVVLFGIFIAVVGAALFVIPLVVESNPDFGLYDLVRKLVVVGGGGIVLVGLAMAIRAVTWKTENNLALMVGEAIGQYYDDRYTFIRNISKWRVGYIDAVLVGPPGVLVFRITDAEGVYFNDGPKWLKQKDKGQWGTLRWNPTREVVVDIRKLREFFARHGLDIPVFGVIVFTKEPPLAQYSVQNPVAQVVHLSEFSYNLTDTYFAKERIDTETVNRVVKLLYAH